MLLSICIPNYNRVQELTRLLESILVQATDRMQEQIEICISDDHSTECPRSAVDRLMKQFSKMHIVYNENAHNLGMADNFLRCVSMASGRYCWLIGNDDIVKPGALEYIISKINEYNEQIDFIITPFDSYNSSNRTSSIVYPKKSRVEYLYDIKSSKDFEDYFYDVDFEGGNQGIFCFLSNLIFKKTNWNKYCNKEAVDLNSIYVQAEIHLSTIKNHAKILYLPNSIVIRECADDSTALFKPKFFYSVVKDLYHLVSTYFSGDLKELFYANYVPQWPHYYARFWDSDIDLVRFDLYKVNFEPIELLKRIVLRKKDLNLLQSKGVYLFGTGKVADRVYEGLIENNIRVKGYFDNDLNQWGNEKNGLRIDNPSKLENTESNDIIVLIASSFYKEIYNQLKKYGIPDNQIRCIDNLDKFF